MEYTITFTPKSIARRLNVPVEVVEDQWEQFETYLDNFRDNEMGEVLWDDLYMVAEDYDIELPEDDLEEKQ